MGTQADASEIEVTPAMIEAGVEELCLYSSKEDSPEVAVRMIFEAMISRHAKSNRLLSHIVEPH